MKKPALMRIGAAALCALGLNGCIAVALPVLAGAAIGREELRSESNASNEPEVEVASDVVPTQVRQESVAEVAEVAPSPTEAVPTPGLGGQSDDDLLNIDDASEVTVIRGPLPAPGRAPSPDIDNSGAFESLIRYASDQAAPIAPGSPKLSAYLEKPSALDGKRAECVARSAMVLIDLDPKDAEFVPNEDAKAATSLSTGLAELRDKGVAIAWISRASVWFAGDIRVTLKQSGLDPAGKDQLILMRYPGDRKQTRRKDLAGSACVIAIAGDVREDFDELYEYLRHPEAAGSLEALIGKGWFLVPQIFDEGEQ
ncbi:MAG: hypothetical protein ABJP70_04480 [Erythrobacter sp.]